MRVKWTEAALNDLSHQAHYIALDNPRAAAAVIGRVGQAAALIERHPSMAALWRPPDIRRLPVRRTGLVIYYRVQRQRVVILRVLHGARQVPVAL